MPIVLIIGPYRFFFYSNEGTPLKSPHIHVRSADGEAKFGLMAPYPVILNSGFSAHELNKIRSLIKDNQAALMGAWYEYFA